MEGFIDDEIKITLRAKCRRKDIELTSDRCGASCALCCVPNFRFRIAVCYPSTYSTCKSHSLSDSSLLRISSWLLGYQRSKLSWRISLPIMDEKVSLCFMLMLRWIWTVLQEKKKKKKQRLRISPGRWRHMTSTEWHGWHMAGLGKRRRFVCFSHGRSSGPSFFSLCFLWGASIALWKYYHRRLCCYGVWHAKLWPKRLSAVV